MGTPHWDLAHIPRELRQGNVGYGLGLTQVIKPPNPAAAASFVRTVPGEYWERFLSVAAQLVTSAVAGSRSLGLAFLDGDGTTINLTPISNEIGPSQTLQTYGDLAGVTPVEAPASHQNEASQTAPAAGTTIATVTLPGGGWTINWVVMLTGTPAAGEVNNFGLYNGAVLVLQSENGIVVGQEYPQLSVEVQVPIGGATYNIKNVGIGTAGAVYTAQIAAIPANVPALQYQMPDFMMRSGWGVSLVLGSAQAGDQISGVILLAERFPSDAAAGYRPGDGPLFTPGPRIPGTG